MHVWRKVCFFLKDGRADTLGYMIAKNIYSRDIINKKIHKELPREFLMS